MSVSVIIPCYKDSSTLGRALDSVYAQTYCVDEIIVVNDASPETAAIKLELQSYPNVRYLENPVNIGLAATRNTGVRNASSEIIAFLDADDELHSQKIQLQLQLYKEDRVVSCATKRVSSDLQRFDSLSYNNSVPYRKMSMSIGSLIRNNITGASMMISRELFNSMGGYDETLLSCEDFDFWLRLLIQGVEIYDVKLPLYFYFINPKGLSSNLKKISYWELKVIEKFFTKNRDVGIYKFCESIILFVWLARHRVRYQLCGDSDYKQSIEQNVILLVNHPFARLIFIIFTWARFDVCLSMWLKLNAGRRWL
jgi:glycosyltransferase involved in cell wall biosynthesis